MASNYSQRAPWYAIEYQEEQDLDFLAGLASSPGVGSVLEIPCGAGRATRRLASTGREIVAADLEPAMLDAVAARFPGGRPPANLTLVRADMCALDLGRRFDLVLVPREAIQLLAEDGEVAAALAALARHLAPAARLVLDLAPLGLVSPPAGRDLHLCPGYFDPSAPPGAWVEEWTREAGPARLSRRRRQGAPDRGRIRIDFEYEAEDPGHGTRRWSSSMVMRDHSPDAIPGLAAAAGLRPAAILGAYDGRPYRPGDPRLVAVLEAADGR